MTSICGKCGGRIPAGRDVCPECSPPRRKGETVPVFLVLALLCSSFLLVGTSFVNVQTAPAVRRKPVGDLNLEAYNAARQYVAEKNTNIQTVSEYFQSTVEHTDHLFTVTLATDETDSDSRRVRNIYRVEMEFADDNWALKSINQ